VPIEAHYSPAMLSGNVHRTQERLLPSEYAVRGTVSDSLPI